MPDKIESASIKSKVAEKVVEKLVEKIVDEIAEGATKKVGELGTEVVVAKSCEDIDEEEITAEDTQSEFEFEWDAEDITRATRDLMKETKGNVKKALNKKIAEYKITWECKDKCVAFIEAPPPVYKFSEAADGWETGTGGIGKWLSFTCTGTVAIKKGCKSPLKS